MLKRILLALFIGSSVYAGGPLQSDRYFENNGGLFDHISPLLVPNKNAAAIINITLDDRGQLTKRNGYTILNTTGALTTSAVTGGGYHTATSGANFFSVIIGTNVYRTGNTFNGTYTNVTGTTTITAGSSNLAQHTSLNDVQIYCNESDKPFKLASTGNAVHLSTGLFTGATTCSTYGNYLVLGNTTESGTSYPSRIRWSDINTPDAFPGLNYIDVEPNDGDKIVGLISFDDSVYIFKKRSIHRMLITGLDGPDAFIIRPVVRNIGAWAKNSIKVIPGVGIAFLAQNTAYVLSDSGLVPIGDPIQRTFDAINRSMWGNAVAGVYPKRYQYWLSVSPSGTTNTQVLVYDYVQKAWTTYSGMSVNMLSQAEDSTGNNLLISGDYSGNVYKQDTGTSDNPANVATAISGSYTTADLTMGSPEVTKNFKYLYLFSQIDSTTTVTVNTYYEYDATAVASSVSIALGTTGALYDTAIYDSSIYPDVRYKATRVDLNRSARAIKLQFTNSDANALVGVIGWVIVYQTEDYKE